MASKKSRPRVARRAADRAAQKLADAAERLFLLERGGSPERPIELASPSQVEIEAESHPCPRCGGRLRVTEHSAKILRGERLRVAELDCQTCRFHGAMYFRLRPHLPN